MNSLATQFPKEQARVREVLKQYIEIGPAGFIGASLIGPAGAFAPKGTVLNSNTT